MDRLSIPGKATEAYVSLFGLVHPLELLGEIYNDINQNWIYKEDPAGEDLPRSAEEMFRMQDFSGDCEDQAILIMAVLKHVKLYGRYCLAKSITGNSGHIWVEVQIGDLLRTSGSVLKSIETVFPKEKIYSDQGAIWLAFISRESYRKYIPEFYAYPGNYTDSFERISLSDNLI